MGKQSVDVSEFCHECVYLPKMGLMFPTRSNYSSSVDSSLSVCIKADPHLMAWSKQTHRAAFINKQTNTTTKTAISKGQQWGCSHMYPVRILGKQRGTLAYLPEQKTAAYWTSVRCSCTRVSWRCLKATLRGLLRQLHTVTHSCRLLLSALTLSLSYSLACGLWGRKD